MWMSVEWPSDLVNRAGSQKPEMKRAPGGCTLQQISIQSLKSWPMKLMVNSYIGEPPTDAPFKVILFQFINM